MWVSGFYLKCAIGLVEPFFQHISVLCVDRSARLCVLLTAPLRHYTRKLLWYRSVCLSVKPMLYLFDSYMLSGELAARRRSL